MAERATPRTLPSKRVNSVTSRSASRKGYVRKTIASDSFSAMEAQLIILDCNGAMVRWKGAGCEQVNRATQRAEKGKARVCKRVHAPVRKWTIRFYRPKYLALRSVKLFHFSG